MRQDRVGFRTGRFGFNLLLSTKDANGKKWIENVEEADFEGVSGKIEFDDIGVRKPEVKIVQIKDGKIPEIK